MARRGRVRVAVPPEDARRLLRLVRAEERAQAVARERLAVALRELAEQGYSVRALADVVGVSPSQVHRLVRDGD